MMNSVNNNIEMALQETGKSINKMNKFENLKTEAVEMSQKSCCNFQHGCLIVKQGRVVSSACNDENGHAEYNAVKALQRLLCERRKAI